MISKRKISSFLYFLWYIHSRPFKLNIKDGHVPNEMVRKLQRPPVPMKQHYAWQVMNAPIAWANFGVQVVLPGPSLCQLHRYFWIPSGFHCRCVSCWCAIPPNVFWVIKWNNWWDRWETAGLCSSKRKRSARGRTFYDYPYSYSYFKCWTSERKSQGYTRQEHW